MLKGFRANYSLILQVGGTIMETSLKDRDKVGVQDTVLLENYTDENVFVDNLKKRFKEDLIYVSHYYDMLLIN